MTMMTFRTQTPQSCGIVEIDSRGVVQQFFEKQPTDHGNLANAAIYLIEPSVIFWLSGQPPITDISTELIPRLLGKMNTWYNERTLIDIGSPASLQSANELIQKGGPL
jgi:mannose-1-phosphate guanylyltransferase